MCEENFFWYMTMSFSSVLFCCDYLTNPCLRTSASNR